MEVVEVDGAFGEGGGQILRTAIAFSIIQHRRVAIRKIRAGRELPGLRQQHVVTLQVLGRLFGAELKGAVVGSSEVSFAPGAVQTSTADLDMKTAASITLLLQALVPAVALSRSGAHLAVTGGTDVPWSPTLDYLSYVVRPAYELLGIRFSVVAERRGYYPRGGGRVKVEVEPSRGLRPLLLTEPRPLPEVNVVSRCANLPRHVAERQMDSMERAFSKRIQISSRIVSVENAASPGSTTLAYSVEPGRIIGADALGARGRPAEDVGMAAAHAFIAAAESRACVDNNLADMIAPLLSLSEEESVLRVPTVSLHLRTSLHVARQFTGCEYSWSQEHDCVLLSIRPVPGHNV